MVRCPHRGTSGLLHKPGSSLLTAQQGLPLPPKPRLHGRRCPCSPGPRKTPLEQLTRTQNPTAWDEGAGGKEVGWRNLKAVSNPALSQFTHLTNTSIRV